MHFTDLKVNTGDERQNVYGDKPIYKLEICIEFCFMLHLAFTIFGKNGQVKDKRLTGGWQSSATYI